MGLADLAEWQWADYPNYHVSRRNLAIHIVAVPLFLLGNVTVLSGAVVLSWWLTLVGLAITAFGYGAQGLGHKSEPVPPVPFKGPANFVGRMFVEQWVTF